MCRGNVDTLREKTSGIKLLIYNQSLCYCYIYSPNKLKVIIIYLTIYSINLIDIQRLWF